MTNILVTGASGFIGKAVTSKLIEDNHKVYVLQRSSSQNKHIYEELRERLILFDRTEEIPDLLKSIKIDVVFHLATLYQKASEKQDINALIESNISLGTHVLEGVKQSQPQFILTQSFFQYFKNSSHPSSLYAASKQAFTEVAKYYSSVYNFVLTELVIYETYGPEDTRKKIIPSLIEASIQSEKFVIEQKNTLLNLVYISDVVDALTSVIGRNSAEIFSVKPEQPIPILEVVKQIEETTSKELDIDFKNNDIIASPNLAGDWNTPPGWKPKISITEGISQCISSKLRN